jgi:hypothetical protein
MIIPSPFESINARALTPVQVAQTFVPSSHFRELCRRRHSIVLGPRGSGKTTLLKMLQPTALASWPHDYAEEIAHTIDFTGIFVATDISWSEQLKLLGRNNLEKQFSSLLSIASFTTHALRAVLNAFQQRIAASDAGSSRVLPIAKLSAQTEAQIVSHIARAWHVEHIAPSLFSLRNSLTQRLVQIGEIGSRELTLGATGRNERLAQFSFLHLPFLQASAYAIEVFEDLLQLAPGKWGFAFDELELAPESIQEELIRSIRSTDDRFLFKLALNPFTSNTPLLQNPLSPAPGQDFDQISLWYAERRGAHAFCEELWHELVRQYGWPDLSPRDVLGNSYFESSEEDKEADRKAYAPGSRWAKRFSSLAVKDPSFRSYVDRRQIDLKRLHLMDDDLRAAEVRKVAPIVALREFHIREPENDPVAGDSLRSRKTAAIYTGADSVFALTEGNPRIFIALIGSLLQEAKTRNTASIPPHVQADKLLATAERFLATLRTIPIERSRTGVQMGVIDLLRKVARFFHDDAVRGEFKPAPVGSFIIDTRTPDSVLNALAQALNAGAIIYVPDDEGRVILTSLRGKKFRLSYLLAPIYGFPIRLGREIALSRILGLLDSPTPVVKPLKFDFREEV